MKLSVLLVVTLLALQSVALHAQSDGIYWISDEPTGSSVMTVNDRNVFLGEPFVENFDEIKLISQTNDNTKYQLILIQNKPYGTGPGGHRQVLVLQKKGLVLDGFGGSTERYWDVDVPDLDFVGEAAAFFKITPQDRHHPDHQFMTHFKVKTGGYTLSGPITVTLEIINCGDKSFYIQHPTVPEGPISPFSFTAYTSYRQSSPEDNTVENQPHLPVLLAGFMTTIKELKPKETLSIPVDLRSELVIKSAGTYDIRGTYKFKVFAPGKGYRVLWDDFATDEFEVLIK
jgi:hypothetical protein